MKLAKEYTVPAEIVKSVEALIMNCNNIAEIPRDKLQRYKASFMNYVKECSAIYALDHEDGIISFVFSPNEDLSFQQKIVLSTAMFHLINSSLYNPIIDSGSGLPYTLLKSSADNPDKMKKAGINFHTPETKLGYHNDVYTSNGQYFLPKYTSLINLFIGYEDPGNFYYINKNNCSQFNTSFLEGVHNKAHFRPTPIVYESDLKAHTINSKVKEWSKVTAFWEGESKERYALLNGDVVDSGNCTAISDLKDALLNSNSKMSVPQGLNRIIVFRNDKGYHSRDIFERQYVFEGVTRMLLRSTSTEAISTPI